MSAGLERMGARVRSMRAARQLTQDQVSGLTMIRQMTLSNIERGTVKPHKPTLQKLAKFYNVTADYLLYGTKQDN